MTAEEYDAMLARIDERTLAIKEDIGSINDHLEKINGRIASTCSRVDHLEGAKETQAWQIRSLWAITGGWVIASIAALLKHIGLG